MNMVASGGENGFYGAGSMGAPSHVNLGDTREAFARVNSTYLFPTGNHMARLLTEQRGSTPTRRI
jgi:hypothetical protein